MNRLEKKIIRSILEAQKYIIELHSIQQNSLVEEIKEDQDAN